MAEAAASLISHGALNLIFNDRAKLEQDFPVPVLQCVQIKPLASQTAGGPERYRVVLSDTVNFVQTMLATQANAVVHEDKLKRGSIVRLKLFQANAVKGKRILIIMDLEVLEQFGELEKIGDPQPLKLTDEGGEEDSKPMSTTIASNGFYGNKPQQQATPAPTAHLQQNASANLPQNSSANIYPIEALSPYASKCTIRARVTSKSEIRTWHKASGPGKLFSVNLLDESGEIKATGFNSECDRLYDVFQEGSVYYISHPFRVHFAKKQFSNLPNDYEITLDRDTVVELAKDQESVPQIRFNFTTIGDLQSVEKDTTIDVIGVLKEVHDVSQITSTKTSKPYDKRELSLVDNSGYSVRMTVWGKTAVSFDAPANSVVAFKGAKVSDFGGRSLSLLASGSMSVDPDIPEAHKLKGWYDTQGQSDNFASHSNLASAGAAGGRNDPLKTITQVKEENLGTSDEAEYFSVKATIVRLRAENCSYPACLNESCNKKVTDTGNGWRCEKCDQTHIKPEYRYTLRFNINDHTGQMWLSCFDDVGRMIMGMTADELNELRETDDTAAQKAFEDATLKSYTFRCRARLNTFQDVQSVRYQVNSAAPTNPVSEAHRLMELLKLYNNE